MVSYLNVSISIIPKLGLIILIYGELLGARVSTNRVESRVEYSQNASNNLALRHLQHPWLQGETDILEMLVFFKTVLEHFTKQESDLCHCQIPLNGDSVPKETRTRSLLKACNIWASIWNRVEILLKSKRLPGPVKVPD